VTGAIPDPDFPVSHCAVCGRDVLTHLALDARGDEHRLCLHCDAEMDPAEVRWVLAAELATLGYEVAGQSRGCGSGGCGGGSCGSRS
jgi:hypothetical protein